MPIPTNPVILSADSFSFITGADKSVMRERLGVATYSTTYYVKTYDQLQAALTSCGLNGGGIIYIDGTIVIPPNVNPNFASGTGGLNITVPNVIITGYPNGKSVLKLQAGASYTYQILSVININASNVTIENITIEGVIVRYIFNTTNTLLPASGIHFGRGVSNPGISDITIRNNHIFNTANAIFQTGGSGSPINRNINISGNKIRTSGYGLYLEQSIEGMLIAENSIVGDGALYDGSKYSYGNCIWVGYGINRCRIVNNHCADHQRMGIEVFWPYRNAHTAGQNPSLASRDTPAAGVVVTNNTITNCGSMGISFAGARGSVVSNNTISDVVFVGLEIVGDDRNSTTQVPDRIVNATVIGNTIKNVRATPRRLRSTAPVTPWLYGYSNMELEPSSCSLSAQRFRNQILSNNTVSYTTGSKSIIITGDDYFAEYSIGKQVKLNRADNAVNYMIGTVTNIETFEGDPDTYLTINVTSLAPDTTSSSSLFQFKLCPYGLRTIGIPSLPLIWSGNSSLAVGLSGAGGGAAGTSLYIRTPGYTNNTTRDQWMQCYVHSYTLSANTAVVNITNTSSTAFNNDSWIAFPTQMVVGLSIDQIDGCRASGNIIDTVLDASGSLRFGCQIYESSNVSFDNNTLIRAGLRYLFVNNSNYVTITNNTFRSGDTVMVRDSTTLNITKLGEDTSFPEDIRLNGYSAFPCSLYAIFTSGAIGYNASAPYNNCRLIFRDNTITPVAGVNELYILSNGAAVFSQPNSRPESIFGSSIRYKSTNHTGGYADPVGYNSPVLDYTQKWNNVNTLTNQQTRSFTSYRFNTDVGLSDEYSRVFDISVGDEIYTHARSWTSSSTNNLSAAFQPKTWTIAGTTTIPASSVPVGTYVRCTGSRLAGTNPVEGFVEGRVTSYTGTNTFTMSASFAQTFGSGTLTSSLTSWRIDFDTTALFVDKFAQLNLRSNVVLDYHTGTKFGTSSAQKLSFWNRPPVIQPAAVAKASDATSVIAQLNTLIDRLSSIGILAS
jgi:parallel beta-helix repeat protein